MPISKLVVGWSHALAFALRHGFAFGFWLRDRAGVRSSFVSALLLIRSLLRSLFRAIFESTPAAPPSRAPPRAMPWRCPGPCPRIRRNVETLPATSLPQVVNLASRML